VIEIVKKILMDWSKMRLIVVKKRKKNQTLKMKIILLAYKP